ncbi:MAG: tRNA (adenosine(37)-N6)-dimethylallyltransferase MiaA [Desulfarculaceae bacterium]|nr:tRNA (adenosine(37)-N6)-dimethylallyltransferase MiaA [Desulfarculaceae bacterium]MCF8048783.1 tRNA (adenosine(37)-N6)-dimethylallyltransferase MiaA [Desulfarculaceae bacterium]MCF8065757.1 tRNA (adenosine(37)-N6)-dimethylallyltransferase MiaA [Desulfarculaceae bacterium]MCF8096960.1 tRNA (adenosine(37)-N6)-dimethylallyltransferase MiaA [Desulfarculaceae bacterium]MCF8122654.1 tRNA (adenosine(37)-N6)-dimethylallyltransferase MiaA [Desulfarculaceae bacterium]
MSAPLVVLAGPTAVGKTGLSLELAQRFEAEIVGADSVQIYRGLDIGSAKPTPEEQAQARHHLIDVAEPTETFSAARYARLAEEAVADIHARGKRALVVGGTGLYIKALIFGLAPTPPVDQELRARLKQQWEQQGPQATHQRLVELDPATAAKLHPNDRQRVLRALEVCLQTGGPISRRQQDHGFASPRHPHLIIGLQRPRAELNQRIEQRARAMWAEGLLSEVESLLAAGVPPEAPGLGSLGYRQAVAFLNGQMRSDDALFDMIKKTKAYAKRQLTWFRGAQGLVWHDADDFLGIGRRVSPFLS